MIELCHKSHREERGWKNMQQKAQKSKFVGPEEKRSEPVLGAEDQIRYIPNAVEITEDCPDNLEVLILEGVEASTAFLSDGSTYAK